MLMKKIFGIVIIILGIGLLAGGGYYAYLQYWAPDNTQLPFQGSPAPDRQPVESEPEDAGSGSELPDSGGKQVIEADPGDQEKNGPSQPTPVRQQGEKDRILRMAGSFAERFGSYSNQSDFGNITDLELYMTGSMKEWAEDFVAENRKNKTGQEEYYGIVTQTVATEIKNLDDDAGQAVVMVDTRRREMGQADKDSQTFSQPLRLEFSRQNGNWKINKASWQ